MLNGSESYDPDGEIVNYSWSYSFQTSFSEKIGYGKKVNFTPPHEGNFTITLKVTDDDNSENISSTYLNAKNDSEEEIPDDDDEDYESGGNNPPPSTPPPVTPPDLNDNNNFPPENKKPVAKTNGPYLSLIHI